MHALPSGRVSRGATWALLAALAACNRTGDEMTWARAALERNSGLEIVAEDADARTFTVRTKDSGELKVVRADEIAATVAQPSEAPSAATSASAANDVPAQAAPAAPEAPEPGELASTPPPSELERTEAPREPVAAAGSGRVIASGPGYSIQAGEQSPSPAGRAGDAPTGAVERRTEPLVCQGSRFLRIDGRNISFESDALVVEEGCELHVTNSRITATGVGIAVRGANVHIRNSTVVGNSVAIDASGNSQIYAHSSEFRGMVRRQDDAVLHDMGGNVWN